jgi:hypothetical protein
MIIKVMRIEEKNNKLTANSLQFGEREKGKKE